MKRFTTLLLLAFGAILGLTSCSSEPESDALTGTVWSIKNLRSYSGTSTTTIDVTISFLRKGQAHVKVAYGEYTYDSNGNSSRRTERTSTNAQTTGYVYRNGVVHLNRPNFPGFEGQSLEKTTVKLIVDQLEADAAVDLQAGTMTFNPTDDRKRFIFHLQKR